MAEVVRAAEAPSVGDVGSPRSAHFLLSRIVYPHSGHSALRSRVDCFLGLVVRPQDDRPYVLVTW